MGLPAPALGSDANAAPEARELARALSISRTLAAWLVQRGMQDVDKVRRFLSPRLAELTSPANMLDRAIGADRLARAVRARERIAVFGDYDCDGITAAAVLTELLRAVDADVVTLIASRFEGGYGVSPQAVERIVASGASLLVTCDCGSSDHVSLADLRTRGLDVIVIDHHLVPDEPLPVLAFLNPHRPGCGFPEKGLASCALALSLGAAVRAELGRKLDLRQVLDLVAIGTVADVAPLVGDNRALVRAGLAVLSEARRPGLRALMELAKMERGARLCAEDIAFRIAPRLNAPGRLGSPAIALELLLETNQDRADQLAGDIEQQTELRRAVQDRMIAEAEAEIRERCWEDRPALVLGREGWGHGIVGIVAGRLADRFERPVIVIGFENGHGRGSVRGPRGSRLHDALSRVSELLVRFGGHQAAAGLEVSIERLEELREAFEASVLAGGSAPALDVARHDLALSTGDKLSRVLGDFFLLEPCGEGNPSPELRLDAKLLRAREVTGGHLKLELELDGGERLGAFGPCLGARAAELGERVVVSGRLRPDRFRGGDAVELRITRIG
ncbi:MAG TPA: single-stranded-DNA-specific exonuclease RecJ [Polyangiaceae bacterium]